MIDRFRLLRDAANEPEAVAGTIVYGCAHHDYGLASDDTRATGVPHMSVTLNSDGSYPFFTVPERDAEPLLD